MSESTENDHKSLDRMLVLDAPGINGMGPRSSELLAAYIEAGGPILHPMNPSPEHQEKVMSAVQAAELSIQGTPSD